MQITRIIYITLEFLVFSLINLLLFISLKNKVNFRFQNMKNCKIDKEKIAEKLKNKLNYKQRLLLKKKKDLLYQEELLNNKKKELEKHYIQRESEWKEILKNEMNNFEKNYFREVDLIWKEKIKRIIYKVILGKK